jgi:tellurite resistance protein TerC
MTIAWIGFITFVLFALALDLGVFHRTAHVVKVREAVIWSCIWVTLGLSFGVLVYFGYENHWFELGNTVDPVDGLINTGRTAAEKYLTGFVVEWSLSVDNIFVIAMLFGFFAVPPMYQHRVLFWGILGALAMRGVMIALGAKLIADFHWMIYVFAGLLILTSIKMLFLESELHDPNKNIIVRMVRKSIGVTSRFHGQRFYVRAGSEASHAPAYPGAPVERDEEVERANPGALLLTPLALALVMVEITDLIFAVDSIPAIFAITGDPFLVFTSNVFAILGLRSLYFALGGMVDKFRFLKFALAIVLMVVGLKMIFAKALKSALGEHFNLYLLLVVVGILTMGVVASLAADRRDAKNGVKK